MKKLYTLIMLLVSICMFANKPHDLATSPANPYTEIDSLIMGTWYAADKTPLVFGEDGCVTMNGTRYQYKFVPAQGILLLYDEAGKFAYCNDVYMLEDDYLLMESKSGSGEYTRTMPVVNVSSITLSFTTLTISLDGFHKLTATVFPSYADNAKLVWTSSNEDVVAVINGTVIAIDEGTAVVTATAADGSGVKAECVVTVKEGKYKDSHEYVDLGLPSGILWATCNIGASFPEDYGDYFAWGETEPKSMYNWSTYKWCNGSDETMTKYCTDPSYGTVDNKTVLDPEDDAAHVNWGGNWRMPTKAEFDELFNSDYCSPVVIMQDGVIGCKITSNVNGNSLFLPASGYRDGNGDHHVDISGYYWTSSLYSGYSSGAWVELFTTSAVRRWDYYRYYGQPVRPVCK